MVRGLTGLIATVWLVNGLAAKVLNLVPRHTAIVAAILGDAHARPLTVVIGLSEVALGAWILTGRRRRATAWLQITLVATMNVLETFLVPDLLLWGRANLLFAAIFCGVVYWHGIALRPPPHAPAAPTSLRR